MIKKGENMKIKLSVKEAKMLLNCLYGTQCITNTNSEVCMNKSEACMNKPEEPTVLSVEEVHTNIVEMCMHNKVKLYINEVLIYATDRPDYDRIADALSPYDGEIVSIININDSENWYINTL